MYNREQSVSNNTPSLRGLLIFIFWQTICSAAVDFPSANQLTEHHVIFCCSWLMFGWLLYLLQLHSTLITNKGVFRELAHYLKYSVNVVCLSVTIKHARLVNVVSSVLKVNWRSVIAEQKLRVKTDGIYFALLNPKDWSNYTSCSAGLETATHEQDESNWMFFKRWQASLVCI